MPNIFNEIWGFVSQENTYYNIKEAWTLEVILAINLKWTADFIFHILKAMTALYCVSQCTSTIEQAFIVENSYTSFHNSAYSTVVIHSTWSWNPRLLNPRVFQEIFRKSSHHMNTDKGSVVKQSGNDVEGCRSQKFCFNPTWAYFCNTL